MCVPVANPAHAQNAFPKTDGALPRTYVDKDRGALWPRLKWGMLIYLGLVHVLGMVGIALALGGHATKVQLLWCFCTYMMAGLGITAGAHRLWAHKSYKASPLMKGILLVFNSISNQGTIFHWARDHRVHHKFSECNADPHNANRGFFFSHMGWLVVSKDPEVTLAGKMIDLSDLKADPFVSFQQRYNPVWNLSFCFIIPALVPTLWGDGDFMINFWLATARYVTMLHATWAVNSFAHFFGGHPYEKQERGPAENPLVSIVAIGEGWHNWHHKYPFDYAASELGISEQFNPTKLFIDGAAKLGLVTDRRRMTHLWAKREAMILKENPTHRSVLSGPTFFKRRYIEAEFPKEQ